MWGSFAAGRYRRHLHGDGIERGRRGSDERNGDGDGHSSIGLNAGLDGGDGLDVRTDSNSCTRSDVLAAGASYPAITVTVDVASDATSPQVNSVDGDRAVDQRRQRRRIRR